MLSSRHVEFRVLTGHPGVPPVLWCLSEVTLRGDGFGVWLLTGLCIHIILITEDALLEELSLSLCEMDTHTQSESKFDLLWEVQF